MILYSCDISRLQKYITICYLPILLLPKSFQVIRFSFYINKNILVSDISVAIVLFTSSKLSSANVRTIIPSPKDRRKYLQCYLHQKTFIPDGNSNHFLVLTSLSYPTVASNKKKNDVKCCP